MNEQSSYPATQQSTYLNTASCGLLSCQNQELLCQYSRQFAEEGSLARDGWQEEIEVIREEAADFIGAETTEIALITNFTNGVHQVAQLLKEYSPVLVVGDDYPSLILPWHLLGYEVHFLSSRPDGSISLDEIEDSIRRNRIRLLAVSHVQYSSGFRLPLDRLGELCRQYQTRLVVDATQSLGMVPINVKKTPVDVLIGSGYKWMTAGLGNGLLYMREELHAELRPRLLGFGSVGSNFSPPDIPRIPFTPRTLEAGHYNYFSLLPLQQALQELKGIGVPNIFGHLMELRRQLTDNLPTNIRLVSDYPEDYCSSIVVLEGPADAEARLRARNIITSTRPKGLRISPHFYNDAQDIEQLCKALTELG